MSIETQQLQDRIGYKNCRIPHLKSHPRREFLYKGGFFLQITHVDTTVKIPKRLMFQIFLLTLIGIGMVIQLSENKSSPIFLLVILAFFSLMLSISGVLLIKYIKGKNLKKKANQIKDAYDRLLDNFYALRREYNGSAELKEYEECRTLLHKTFTAYCWLPAKLEEKLLDIQQQYYQDELSLYLENFFLLNQKIPGLNKSDVFSLYSKGIVLASDLLGNKLFQCGFEQEIIKAVLAWKDRQIMNFRYVPQTKIIHGLQDDLLHEYKLKCRLFQNQIPTIIMRSKELDTQIRLRRAEIRHLISLLLPELDRSEAALNAFIESSGSRLKVSDQRIIFTREW